MVKSKLARALIDSLDQKRKLAEVRKKEILDYSKKLKKLKETNQISDSKYQELIGKEVDGKKISEWKSEYDSYISYYEEEIKRQKAKKIIRKICVFFIIFTLILTLPLLALTGKLSIIGLSVQEQEETKEAPIEVPGDLEDIPKIDNSIEESSEEPLQKEESEISSDEIQENQINESLTQDSEYIIENNETIIEEGFRERKQFQEKIKKLEVNI